MWLSKRYNVGQKESVLVRRVCRLPSASLLAIAVICFTVTMLVVSSREARAQTERAEELKQSISNNEEEIKRLEAEIADYKIRLDNAGREKQTLQSAIRTLDLTRTKLAKDIELTQAKIARTNITITELGNGIVHKKKQITKNKEVIIGTIKQINELDSRGLLEIMLESDSLSNFFIELDDLSRLQTSLRDNIKSLERIAKELDEQKTSYEKNQRDLIALKVRSADQKTIADGKRRGQATLLVQTKNQEANYAKLLADREARKKQFESEIAAFEKQLRAEIDRNSFPLPGSRVLAYPLDEVFTTQKFGKTVDSTRLYVSGTHNGMDFRAAPGTPLKAAGDGVIAATGDTDRVCPGASYGRWVLIKHKNGLSTLYAHLELIKVSEGQDIHVGEIIGYSGDTGYATGPHLHFGLFVSSAVQIIDLPSKSCPRAVFHIPAAPPDGYLDPAAYL